MVLYSIIYSVIIHFSHFSQFDHFLQDPLPIYIYIYIYIYRAWLCRKLYLFKKTMQTHCQPLITFHLT
ncbi:hypothetical protein Hanom_Chr17g01538511 [Helianthus anomalus]